MSIKSELHVYHELRVLLSLVLLKFIDGLWENMVVGSGFLALSFQRLEKISLSLHCSFENVS